MVISVRSLLQCIASGLFLIPLPATVCAVGLEGQSCKYPSLIDATAEELQDGLSRKCFTSVDLVNAYSMRIKEVNDTLHVVSELNPDAVETAKELDRERHRENIRGPLHGLPILLKGNIGTRDKLQTSAGSYALLNTKLPEDSTVAKKLRDAGAIILGKRLSEWANFRSTNSTNGWNAYGGQVTGAYYPNQDPSGSSSGSGVASDLGLAWATLGTETSGSIVSPGSSNNIVGLKPTVGLTSRYLVIPISAHQDTIGPMTRTVKDTAVLLQAIAGKDRNDNYTSAIPFSNLPDYVSACKLTALEGKRIGVPSNVLESFGKNPTNKPVLDAFRSALSIMESAGAIIVKDTNFTAYQEFVTSDIPGSVLNADFISDLARYFSQLEANPQNIHSLADARKFTQSSPFEQYPNRNTEIWDLALEQGFNNTSPEFWPLYQKNLYFGGEGGLLGALERHNLDATVLPTDAAYPVPGVIGTPVISVPLGAYPEDQKVEHEPRRELVTVSPGFPFGIGFMGKHWSEQELIGMAYAFEQKTKARAELKRYIEPKFELNHN
uniref:Glutamyl-tRNA(Gln) amidotransferase subunit A n=1 Tax=Coccidioides posadasii RMSCC 3488 TaxID=454284 RepID=A0A0J6F9D1_COCPO|nr:LOW QUALITY PROTEIN: glutamyl-tRNA(Gln) amidotransferase subunit A [Coccidioides posadasii RMSCC 3488]